MVSEIKKIIKDSEIMKYVAYKIFHATHAALIPAFASSSNNFNREDDTKWPQKNKDGRQELEIRLGSEHISFETAKIGSLVDVNESEDPEGLRVFYYLVQDLKALVFSLISLHFKVRRSFLRSCRGCRSGGRVADLSRADQTDLRSKTRDGRKVWAERDRLASTG